MMKWRRRASHLGRFTLWHNGPELHNSVDFCGTTATELLHANLLCVAQQPPSYKLGKFILWHNGRRATTQLGRFTLCGTTAAELHNSVDLLCGTTAAELNNPVQLMHAPGGCMQGVERFGRFNKHGSIVDLRQTPEICTLSVTSHAENM